MNRNKMLTILITIIALYHIIVAGNLLTWFGIFIPGQVNRAVTVASALLLIFILTRSRQSQEGKKVPWYDYLLILMTLLGSGYVVFSQDVMIEYSMFGVLDTKGIIFALMLVIPLMEAVRRRTGIVFPLIILFFVGITLFQKYLPGILNGQGYPLDKLLYSAYVGTTGIFGFALGVASTILIVFMIFGAMLQVAGGGQWFIDLSVALTGWSRGGPAKAAVLASAFFGSISGSPSSNVATTGAITIPLMKKVGYKPSFAAATEAVASTGGQILPPVMGAIAFVMADWIGVPYAEIALAALVPALLYFLIAFVSVHLQACKTGVEPMPISQLPNVKKVFKEGWFYLVPLCVLIYFLLFKKLPPHIAGIYTFPFLIGVSFLSKDRSNWLTPKNIVASFQIAIPMWLTVAAITASVGLMVGALELSGLGVKFSRFLIDLSGGDLLLTLVFVGLCSIILGMGMDALVAYMTLAVLMAPALVELGLPVLTAHLFVVYWGMASFITPPVCLAVFVAIGISGSKLWETGFEAIRIGAAVYLIPFAFVYSPGLLLDGNVGSIILAISTAIIGCILLACGLRGFAINHMNMIQRVLISLSGVFLVFSNWYLMAIGVIVAIIVLIWNKTSTVKNISIEA